MSCLFCRIVGGEIPAAVVYQDDEVVAFRDINAQAPLHVLLVPRAHVATVNDLGSEHDAVVGRLVRLAGQIAREHGYGDRGYRVVVNCNAEAGQTVFHLHVHVLAGRQLTWPPG